MGRDQQEIANSAAFKLQLQRVHTYIAAYPAQPQHTPGVFHRKDCRLVLPYTEETPRVVLRSSSLFGDGTIFFSLLLLIESFSSSITLSVPNLLRITISL